MAEYVVVINDAGDMRIVAETVDNAEFYAGPEGTSLDDLRGELARMATALEKPTVHVNDLPVTPVVIDPAKSVEDLTDAPAPDPADPGPSEPSEDEATDPEPTDEG